jgi:predicted metalloendopeptidase
MQHNSLSLVTNFGLLLLFAGCSTAAIVNTSMDMNSTSKNEIADEVLGAMNRCAEPCEDFYEYACGSWIKKTKLLEPRPDYVKVDYPLEDHIKKEIRILLENDLQGKRNKAGEFYASCLQYSNGSFNADPLARFRRVFRNFSTADTLASVVGTLYSQAGLSLFFTPAISPDQDHPERYALKLLEGSSTSPLTLAEKDNGTDATSNAASAGNSGLVVVRALLDAAAKADLIPNVGLARLSENVLELDGSLLNLSLSAIASADSSSTRRSLNSFPPGLFMRTYLNSAGIDIAKLNNSVFVRSPEYFDTIAALLAQATTDPAAREQVRAYMAYQLVYRYAAIGLLGRDLYDAIALPPVGVQPGNWRSEPCQKATVSFMGDAVGKAYVEAHFTEQRRAVANKMVREVVGAFDIVLKSQDWLDDQTRTEARRKLSLVGIKVGYSDALDTYENVTITRDNYAGNVAAAQAHFLRQSVSRLGGPVLQSDWVIRPQDVNAVYAFEKNDVTIPAGILNRPVFDEEFPAAMNYGALGTVIAHELSHGEDNVGRKYDATGRLRNWWSDQNSAQFESRSKCYVSLYDTYKPRGLDLFVNGTFTLGENLADSNGIKISFRAFRNAMKKSFGSKSRIGLPFEDKDMPLVRTSNDRPSNGALARELTNNQLFFVSWAQLWCSVTQETQQRVAIATDSHSPAAFRVLGPLSQMKEFADAFQCKPGSTYNPEKRCYIWQ